MPSTRMGTPLPDSPMPGQTRYTGGMAQKIFRLFTSWSWPLFWRVLWPVVLLGVFLVAVPGVRPDLSGSDFHALGAARDHLFDFVEWEAGTLLDKAANDTLGPQVYMTEDERSHYVGDYLKLVEEIAGIEKQVEQIYIDPSTADPEVASAGLRARRDSLRIEQEQRQALAEAIVQAQVSGILVEHGFGVGGQILPPVSIRFTRLPTILIISPRDHIERTGSYALDHGLTVDQMENIEAGIDEELDVSSLIAPLGGLAVYPAMLIETSYPTHVFEISAHEWLHHYLTFYPLGFNYGVTPELYTMNETVASIVGREIGWEVLARYYPEHAGAPPDWTPLPDEAEQPPSQDEPPAFDFRAEMRETRIRADDLLAAGQIEQAEQYMEERRVFFVEHGYQIRKLNQAYFAFYGSYADEPGATGSDPVGPAVRELRYYSPSLFDFIRRVRGMTSFAQLQVELEEARRQSQMRSAQLSTPGQ
ncbi:MAG: hypothetical protein JXB07_18050 [Anaerolineae bacterium]|nr:hypothetical protein [Anaerolineae bacterium]